MESSASKVGSGEISHAAISPPSSKLKIYGFAIAIIVGIGGLAAVTTGLAGYFHVGALSNMAQVDAIIMMAAGGGGGTILLIIGVVGTVKNQKNGDATRQLGSTKRAEIIRSIDTQDGSVYGPEAWKIWNVDVLDAVPPPPQVDLSQKDKVLLYIPQRIQVDGKEQDLTLKALREISGGPFSYFSKFVEEQFGQTIATSGWVLIDKTVIAESREQNYEAQKKMVEEKGCSIPSILEAVVLNLMVFTFTEKWLDGKEPLKTCCLERLNDKYSVFVGGSTLGLDVDYSYKQKNDAGIGIACVQRNFKTIGN